MTIQKGFTREIGNSYLVSSSLVLRRPGPRIPQSREMPCVTLGVSAGHAQGGPFSVRSSRLADGGRPPPPETGLAVHTSPARAPSGPVLVEIPDSRDLRASGTRWAPRRAESGVRRRPPRRLGSEPLSNPLPAAPAAPTPRGFRASVRSMFFPSRAYFHDRLIFHRSLGAVAGGEGAVAVVIALTAEVLNALPERGRKLGCLSSTALLVGGLRVGEGLTSVRPRRTAPGHSECSPWLAPARPLHLPNLC